MLTVNFKLTSKSDTSETHEVALNFDDHAVGILRAYSKNCDRLRHADLLITGFPHIRKISFDVESGMSVDVSEFSYPALCELLHLARPLFLASEPASYERTMGVIGKTGKNTALVRHLKYIRNVYELGDYAPYFQLSVNGVPLFSDKATQIWLNGVEYHQDQEKAEIVRKIEKFLSRKGALGVFAAHLSGRVRALFELDEFVQMILEKIDGNKEAKHLE